MRHGLPSSYIHSMHYLNLFVRTSQIYEDCETLEVAARITEQERPFLRFLTAQARTPSFKLHVFRKPRHPRSLIFNESNQETYLLERVEATASPAGNGLQSVVY